MRYFNFIKLSLICATILLITITGCSKKKDTEPTCTDGIMNGPETGVDCGGGSCYACSGARIKTMISRSSGGNITATFTYDNLGRIIKEKQVGYQSWGYDVVEINYEYVGNILTVTADNAGSAKDVYTLNSNGWATSYSRMSFVNNDTIFTNETYSYDAEGHRIGAGRVWQNGNLVSGGGPDTYTYSDTINTIAEENKGRIYRGKDSKNLIKTFILYGNTYQQEYEFDAQNRVIKYNGTIYTYY